MVALVSVAFDLEKYVLHRDYCSNWNPYADNQTRWGPNFAYYSIFLCSYTFIKSFYMTLRLFYYHFNFNNVTFTSYGIILIRTMFLELDKSCRTEEPQHFSIRPKSNIEIIICIILWVIVDIMDQSPRIHHL